jgi:hypothetical protein
LDDDIFGYYPSSFLLFKNRKFRRLDSVSVFRRKLFKWAQLKEIVSVSTNMVYKANTTQAPKAVNHQRGLKLLTPFGGSCCVGFINPVNVVAGVLRETSSFFGPILVYPT